MAGKNKEIKNQKYSFSHVIVARVVCRSRDPWKERVYSPAVTERRSGATAAPEGRCPGRRGRGPGRRGGTEPPRVPLNRRRTDRQSTSPSPRPLRPARQKETEGHDAVLGHEAVVHGLHVVFHLVGPRELLGAHRTGEHLALMALVVEERVPLETVLVLKRLLDVELGALGALVDALADGSVTEEI